MAHETYTGATFEECPDCWPFPGSKKPVGHPGRHRRIPKELVSQEGTSILPHSASMYVEERIMQNLDQALPDDDKVLSPEIPLAHVPSNMAELPPLSLEWKDTNISPPTGGGSIGKLSRHLSINKRSRPPSGQDAHKGLLKVSKVGPAAGAQQTAAGSVNGTQAKKNRNRAPTISKEPSTYKAMSDDQLVAEIQRLQDLFDSLRHKHRGGIDCHRCQAKTALQRARRVQSARIHGTPEPVFPASGSRRTTKGRRTRQKRAPSYSRTEATETRGHTSPRSPYSRYRSGSRVSYSSYPGGSPSLCPVDPSIPIGTKFNRTSMIGSFQLPSNPSQEDPLILGLDETGPGFSEWTVISNLNENDLGGSLLENRLHHPGNRSAHEYSGEKAAVPEPIEEKSPMGEKPGEFGFADENEKPPEVDGWAKKMSTLPSVADQVYPIDTSRVLGAKATQSMSVPDAGPVA